MASGARLFDLDGTLWDSFTFYAGVAAEGGAISASAAREALVGGENVMRLMDRLGLPRSLLAVALEQSTTARPHEGIDEVLAELSSRGHQLGVVTNLSGSVALPVLRRLGIDHRFGVVIHAGSGAGRKPSAAPILAALAQLGEIAGPGHAYVGDQVDDQTAAQAAGIQFDWAGWGYGTPPVGAIVLRRPADLLAL